MDIDEKAVKAAIDLARMRYDCQARTQKFIQQTENLKAGEKYSDSIRKIIADTRDAAAEIQSRNLD